MKYAINILECKLQESISHREKLRASLRRKKTKDGEFNETFIRWRNDSTKKIKELKKAISILKNQ